MTARSLVSLLFVRLIAFVPGRACVCLGSLPLAPPQAALSLSLSQKEGCVSVPPHRVEVISELLSRYHELVEPGVREGLAGTGEALALMPATYTASVREIERLLRSMREDRSEALQLVGDRKVSVRALWWHVHHRYIAATTRTVDVEVLKRGKNGKRHRDIERRAVPCFDRAVNPVLVGAGVAWMAENWRLASEPMIPQALLVAA